MAFSERENKMGAARIDTWRGHTKQVTALAWSANGATLASGSADATVRLWPVDPSGAARTPTVLREDSAVTALCWSPEDPNVLATATNDKTIRFWDVRSKRAEQTVSLPRTDSVLYLAWSHDGAVLAAGTKDDTLLLLDARRSTVDARKAAIGGSTIQPFEMNELAWTPDGLLFISAGPKTVVDTYEGIINVVLPKEDLSGVTPVVSLQAHTGQIQSLRFDPAGRHFATGSTDSTINYWSVEDLAVIRCFDRLEFAAKSLSFSFDGAYLATASDDKIVDIIRVSDGSRVRAIQCYDATNLVAWTPAQSLVLAFVEDDLRARDADKGGIRVMAGAS